MPETELLINRGDRDEESQDSLFDTFVKPCLAEFIGTMLFVFVGCLSTGGSELTSVGLAHGLMITLLITGLGEISGGHFNPAVSLGVVLSGTFSKILLIGYFVAQMSGGMVGAAIVKTVLPTKMYKSINGGTHQLGPDVDKGWAILIETLLTLVLVFTVLMAAVNPKTKSKLAPLAIGFAVAVDILAGGPLTGASMNPARAFGPAVCSSAIIKNAWKYHYIYWIGPLLGSLIAGILYSGPLTGASMNPARAFGPAVCSSAIIKNAWKYHYIYWIGPLLGSLIAGILYRSFFANPTQRFVARTTD